MLSDHTTEALLGSDFRMKNESASHGKKGKREYLTDSETMTMLDELNKFL